MPAIGPRWPLEVSWLGATATGGPAGAWRSRFDGLTQLLVTHGYTVMQPNIRGSVGYGKAFLRSLVALLLGYTVIVGILDVLWPLWDKKNQTLHDKAVGTVVLRTRNAG